MNDGEFAKVVARRLAGFGLPAQAIVAKSGNAAEPLKSTGDNVQELRVYMHVNFAGGTRHPSISLAERKRAPTAFAIERLKGIGIDVGETKQTDKDGIVVLWYHAITPGRNLTAFKQFVNELREKT